MIFKICGKVSHQTSQSLVINLGNLDLECHVTDSFLQRCCLGDEVDLFTYLHIRENSWDIYGFSSLAEKRIFEILISVNGVGPKSGLAILSATNEEQIRQAVINNQTIVFSSVSGIGNKTAQRIVLELKSKLTQDNSFDLDQIITPQRKELAEALSKLGYKKKETEAIIPQIPADLNLAKQIKTALKLLSEK